MQDDALVHAQADLIAWGILETTPELIPTRRFRATIARAATVLQSEAAEGAPKDLHPMERAVAHAFTMYPLPAGAQIRREHKMLVVALELASFPEEIRALIGHRG